MATDPHFDLHLESYEKKTSQYKIGREYLYPRTGLVFLLTEIVGDRYYGRVIDPGNPECYHLSKMSRISFWKLSSRFYESVPNTPLHRILLK